MKSKPLIALVCVIIAGPCLARADGREATQSWTPFSINAWDGIDENVVRGKQPAEPASKAAGGVVLYVRWHMLIPLDVNPDPADPDKQLNAFRMIFNPGGNPGAVLALITSANGFQGEAPGDIVALEQDDPGILNAMPDGWTLRICNDHSTNKGFPAHYIEIFYCSNPVEGTAGHPVTAQSLQQFLDQSWSVGAKAAQKKDPDTYAAVAGAVLDPHIRKKLGL